jgi:hypothetical protein
VALFFFGDHMTDRELMQQVLEVLEEIADEVFSPYDNKLGGVILALRERLAQQLVVDVPNPNQLELPL